MSIANKVLRRFGVHNAIYDKEYYETDVEGPAVKSAPHIARSIVERFSPESVVDVGCGTGAMLEAIRALGVPIVRGLEYSAAGLDMCRQRALIVLKHNIEKDDPPTWNNDVVMSMEVAEHLPQKVAPRYVDLLCALGPIVVFTAAKPGQGGTDHVNLQPKEYWIDLFKARKFLFDAENTELLSTQWQANGVQDFYFENLMVFQTPS